MVPSSSVRYTPNNFANTVAGNGVSQFVANGIGSYASFGDPNSLVLDATGQTLFVSDIKFKTLYAVNVSSTAVQVVSINGNNGIGTSFTASASIPVLFDPTQPANLYVGDENQLQYLTYQSSLRYTMRAVSGVAGS